MKKFFLILGIIFTFAISGLSARANNNILHSITFEKNSDSYNVILETDRISNVIRKIESNNELILELSGITSSDTVNVLHKGSTIIDNLVIENSGLHKLKIYISAPNIKSATVVLQPVSGEVFVAGESLPLSKILLIMSTVALLGVVIKHLINCLKQDDNSIIKRDIKEREIELYRQYRNSIDTSISLRSKDVKMQNMLRKIDRKIDERLSFLKK